MITIFSRPRASELNLGHYSKSSPNDATYLAISTSFGIMCHESFSTEKSAHHEHNSTPAPQYSTDSKSHWQDTGLRTRYMATCDDEF